MDSNGMTLLPSHEFFESLLKPRGHRPNQDWSESAAVKFEPFVGICFHASWCGPCKRLDKVSLVKHTPQIKWYSCDVDEIQETLGYCGLSGIPGFVLIKDGQFVNRKTGAGSVNEILQWVYESGFPVSPVN